jgi:hypothetical protein
MNRNLIEMMRMFGTLLDGMVAAVIIGISLAVINGLSANLGGVTITQRWSNFVQNNLPFMAGNGGY